MGVLDFEGGEREGGEREQNGETVRNGDEQRERDSSPRVRDERVGAGRGCGAEFTCVRRESVRRGGTYEGPNLGVPANGESLCTRRAFYLKRVSRHFSLHHTAQAHTAPPASS